MGTLLTLKIGGDKMLQECVLLRMCVEDTEKFLVLVLGGLEFGDGDAIGEMEVDHNIMLALVKWIYEGSQGESRHCGPQNHSDSLFYNGSVFSSLSSALMLCQWKVSCLSP